ncbi:MAG TPA: ABC transporter permease [Candidatus Dormibacteraeota bacterium]|nr:ABC transporter permease [Candidatus Dormibacteraeota bacterium]
MTALTGTGALLRLALRRDRVMIPAWVVGSASIALSTASGFRSLYPTTASRLEFSTTIVHNGTLEALYGPIYEPGSLGGLVAWRALCIIATLAAVMSVLLVVRHTRADEEAGRLELVGATAIGRRAPLAAALLVAAGADLLLGLLIAVTLPGFGLSGAGALAMGAAVAATGLVFAGAAAVSAQLMDSSRAANGLGIGLIVAAFATRAIGDSGIAGWVSWLSPMGWAERVRPFAGERPMVLLLAVAGFAVLVLAATLLVSRRDLGAGLVPPRPGPAHAPASLQGPLGLAWRLHRTQLLGWSAGVAVMGAVGGSVARSVNDFVGSSSQLEDVIRRIGGGRTLVDAYLGTVMGFFGLAAAAYAVLATLRMRTEQSAGRVEPLLATAVSRRRWAWSHLAFTLLGSAVLLATAGFAIGLGDGLRGGDLGGDLGLVFQAGLAQLPAAWVMGGIALLIYAAVPRRAVASWGVFAFFLLLSELGPILRLSGWVTGLSPFAHVARAPGSSLDLGPVLGLVAAAAVLVAAGLAELRRRDLAV